jgi:hypothetical protein
VRALRPRAPAGSFRCVRAVPRSIAVAAPERRRGPELTFGRCPPPGSGALPSRCQISISQNLAQAFGFKNRDQVILRKVGLRRWSARLATSCRKRQLTNAGCCSSRRPCPRNMWRITSSCISRISTCACGTELSPTTSELLTMC